MSTAANWEVVHTASRTAVIQRVSSTQARSYARQMRGCEARCMEGSAAKLWIGSGYIMWAHGSAAEDGHKPSSSAIAPPRGR